VKFSRLQHITKKWRKNCETKKNIIFTPWLCLFGIGLRGYCFAYSANRTVFSCNGILLCKIFAKNARLVCEHENVQKAFGIICAEKGHDSTDKVDDYGKRHTAHGLRLYCDDVKTDLHSMHYSCGGVGVPYRVFCFGRQNN
jgi:hypothetical protein